MQEDLILRLNESAQIYVKDLILGLNASETNHCQPAGAAACVSKSTSLIPSTTVAAFFLSEYDSKPEPLSI